MTIRILIVDDEKLVRAGFRMILTTEADLEIVGEAADGVEAISQTNRLRPDLVIMDIRMPRMDGIEATRQILRGPSGARVLVVTTFDLDEFVYDALRAGATGFLLKDTPEEQLVAAIRAAAEAVTLLTPSITLRLVRAFAEQHRRLAPPQIATLTRRERDVLLLVARGLSNAEIARRLIISDATVKTHVARLLSKLDLDSRTQAAVLAYETGLIQIGRPDELTN